MDRRQFLKIAGCSGLSVALGSHAAADVTGIEPPRVSAPGPLFVLLQALGGWDPTLVCDPKAGLNLSYGEADIATSGNIAYAPVPGAAEFFGAHGQRTLVINGIDVETNSHGAGQRHMASGLLGEGYPNAAALVAGHYGPGLPMAFLRMGGGYTRTQGVVATTPDSLSRLDEVSYPERITATNEDSDLYHSQHSLALLRLARRERLEALQRRQQLPSYQSAVSSMMTARLGAPQLKLLQEFLPAPAGTANERRIQLIMAAHRAGIGVSANLALGGFDTHDDHDNRHRPSVTALYDTLIALWNEAERQELAEDLVVAVISDFGRTPNYNSAMGKDHWPVTSALLVGKGVVGNRVVGATDEGHKPLEIDVDTLQPVDAGGVRIKPAHVHRALRRVAGIEDTDLDERFPLFVDAGLDLLRA